jgi:guanylate kinase
MKEGKVVIFSAPSGAGKSTLINLLVKQEPSFSFSISATNRSPRGNEQHGVEYYFLSTESFKQKIANGEFIEYEEVYPGKFYGTLKKEVEEKLGKGINLFFDVDVKGGLRLKEYFKERALSIFVQPPSVEELKNRLIHRGTESIELIEERLKRSSLELNFASKFDVVIVNDDIQQTVPKVKAIIDQFLIQKE